VYTKKYQTRNKYKAVRQTFNGRSYHSKKEAAYAKDLHYRQLAGEIKEIIPQYKLELYVKGKKICNYYMDFKIVLADDSVQLIEVKGFATDLWRLKWKLTEALLQELEPDAELVLVQ